MLRDNLVGLIEPMRISAGVDPLALRVQKQASDDRSSCLENPRPEGAESSLTENVTSPFQAEPAHEQAYVKTTKNLCLAVLALSLLATPALAQRHSRSNAGGAARGDARADAVQDANKKQDKDRDPAASTNKTHGKHKAKGHRH